MRVLEIAQGHARPRAYDGVPLEDARLDLRAWDEEFFAKHPKAYRWPAWQERDVADDARAPWGFEWYRVGDDGRLATHSAHFDSSD